MAVTAPTSPPASLPVAQANFERLVKEIAWFGLGLPATMNFLSVYAIRIDASATVLGLLSSLPAIFALLTSTVARAWRQRFTDSIRAMWLPGYGMRLVFPLCALTPFLPQEWQQYWLVVAVTLPALPQGLSNVVFLILMRESVEPHRITALTSRRNMFFNLAVAAGTLSMGFWLDAVAFPLNYQVMFLAAFVAAVMSVRLVLQCQPITTSRPPSADAPEISPWHDRRFQKVVFLAIVTHIPMFLIGPIVSLRLVDELDASDGFMAYFALAGQVMAAITAAWTNRIVQVIGSQRTMALGMILMAIMAAMTALFPTLPPMLLAGALGGIGWTLTAISIFGFFNDHMPQEHVARYSTVWSQVTTLCVFIGPLVGSQMVNLGMGVSAVLLVGAALRVISAVLIRMELRSEAQQART